MVNRKGSNQMKTKNLLLASVAFAIWGAILIDMGVIFTGCTCLFIAFLSFVMSPVILEITK